MFGINDVFLYVICNHVYHSNMVNFVLYSLTQIYNLLKAYPSAIVEEDDKGRIPFSEPIMYDELYFISFAVIFILY